MELSNPIWLIFPIASLLLALLMLLLDIRRRKTVPFSALHWLRPTDRTPRRTFIARPPIILTLMAAALVAGAVGTLHWRLIPPAKNDHPIRIWFSLRRLGQRKFAYMRIATKIAHRKFTLVGLGPRVVVSPTQLTEGIVIPLPPGSHPTEVVLSTADKIIWRKRIPQHLFGRSIDVYCARHIDSAVMRALKADAWVRLSRKISRCRLFVGDHLRHHLHINQLILTRDGLHSFIHPGVPVVLAPGDSILADVSFRGVEVRQMALVQRRTGWQTLATVKSHPWILQRHRGNHYAWLITSSLTPTSTNWPRFASFVIFIVNSASISSDSSPSPRWWLTHAVVPAEPLRTSTLHRLPEMGVFFELISAAFSLMALAWITGRSFFGSKKTDAPAGAQSSDSVDVKR